MNSNVSNVSNVSTCMYGKMCMVFLSASELIQLKE